jgi:branched-chain amino acid transport system ATP-binding protein
MSDFILETAGLTKEFKGFAAVSNVDLKVRRGHDPCPDRPERRGQDHLLQPAHQFLVPTRGTITFNGRDITGRSRQPSRRAGALCAPSRSRPSFRI